MEKKEFYISLTILVVLILCFSVYYFYYKSSEESTPSESLKYPFMSKTYNMSGYIREINGDIIKLEDKTPYPSTQTVASDTPQIVEIKMAPNVVVAIEDTYITASQLQVNSYVLLKTDVEDNQIVAKEIFIFPYSSLH